MSEIQKCPNLVRGGGSTILKNVSNSKMSQRSEGGSTLIGTLSQIFSIFYFDASPNKENWIGFETIESNPVLDNAPFVY